MASHHPLQVARVYLRTSTSEQDLSRQHAIIEQARAAGFYIAGVYAEHASGAIAERPELKRLIADLQPGDVVIAEKIDRISRLPLPEAEALIASMTSKGARLCVPGVVDLSEITAASDGVARVVLEGVQAMLLRLALQMARDDYETMRERQRQGIAIAKRKGKYTGRKADKRLHAQIIALRPHHSIAKTAELAGCSQALVKRVVAKSKNK
jgi:DNA invertase Pin-like site-specific DNA recombinase